MEVEAESSSGNHGVRGKVKKTIGSESWRLKQKVVVKTVGWRQKFEVEVESSSGKREVEGRGQGLIGGRGWKQ